MRYGRRHLHLAHQFGRTVTNPNKAKGSAFESALTKWLNDNGHPCKRTIAGATLDEGDIWLPNLPFTIDAKNCQRLELAKWTARADEQAGHMGKPVGLVWVKRRGVASPGGGFVCMSPDSFLRLAEVVR
jgi:hypothetical protein